MTAVTVQASPHAYRSPLVWSVVAHLVLVALLSSSLVFVPDPSFQQLAIEAVVVDQGAIDRTREQERMQAAEAERKKQAEQREREQELAAQQQADEAAREKRVAEQREAEQQRQQEAEQQRRTAEAEAAKRKQQEAEAAAMRKQQEAEQAAKRKQQEAEQAAKRAEEKRAAEARARAAAEKAEQQRLQAELSAALAEEEALLAATQSGEMNRYKTLIQQRVQRKWQQPASAIAGVECQVSVQQLPSGEVIEARVTRCNGDEIVRRSVENAVYAASPLPLPEDRRLFDRHLTFSFRPQVQN